MLYAHVENGSVTYRAGLPRNWLIYPVDDLWETNKYSCNELLSA